MRSLACLVRDSTWHHRVWPAPAACQLLFQSVQTLVELMIAIFVLLVGVLGSVALVDGANRGTASTRAREGATNLARDVIEGMHNIPIKQAVASGANLPATLSAGGVGGTVTGSVWKVSRRNFTYTVQVSACAMDDANASHRAAMTMLIDLSATISEPPEFFFSRTN